MLSVEKAVDLLKKEGITESKEMVRRWVRQGKIQHAVRKSRKTGWQIPEESLRQFIHTYKESKSNDKRSDDYKKGYQQGLTDARAEMKKRDYHLLRESQVYERSFSLNRTDFMEQAASTFMDPEKNKEFKAFLDQTLFAKYVKNPRKTLDVYILGDWIMVGETLEVFELTTLPEPEQILSDRLTYALIEKCAKEFFKQ